MPTLAFSHLHLPGTVIQFQLSQLDCLHCTIIELAFIHFCLCLNFNYFCFQNSFPHSAFYSTNLYFNFLILFFPLLLSIFKFKRFIKDIEYCLFNLYINFDQHFLLN